MAKLRAVLLLCSEGDMKTFDAVLPHLKKSVKRITIGLIVLCLVDAIQLIIPKIIQSTIDSIGKPGFTQSDIVIKALLILFMAGGIVALRYLWRILIIGNSWELEKGLRQRYYNHLLKLSQNFFNFSKIGDLMAYSINDLNAVRMLFGMGFIAAADIFLMTIASFLFMVSINVKLTLLSIIPLPFLSITIHYFGKRMHKRFGKVQEAFAKLSGMVQESISGIRVVKAFVQEKEELKKMSQFSDDYVQQNISMAKLSGMFHPFMGFTISISMVIVLIYGGKATLEGQITIGGFIAFFSYLGMLVWPMIAIGWIVDMYQRGTASLKRLNAIWNSTPEIEDNEFTDHQIRSLQGNIDIRDLHFQYTPDTPKIFNGFSMKINKGSTLAIVGKTGCGKTTFVDLLTRVYNPPQNSIYLDGHELYTIPLEILRHSMVMVPQDIFLFSDTIANNIAMGKPEASREEIEQAAKYACVHDDIIAFEDKYETIVGERGVTLSGGQKQRIAIARALLCNPEFLIMDDALSAVDTKTERYILDYLLEIRKGRTSVIIAHRISSIQHADIICVLQDGKVAECGNHEELIALGGQYSELYDKQKIEEKIEGEV